MSKVPNNLDNTLLQYLSDCPQDDPNLQIEFNIRGRTAKYDIDKITNNNNNLYKFNLTIFQLPMSYKSVNLHINRMSRLNCANIINQNTLVNIMGDYDIDIPDNITQKGIHAIRFGTYSKVDILCYIILDLDADIPTLICEEIDYEKYIKPKKLND